MTAANPCDIRVAWTCDFCGYTGGLEIVNGKIRCPKCRESKFTGKFNVTLNKVKQ